MSANHPRRRRRILKSAVICLLLLGGVSWGQGGPVDLNRVRVERYYDRQSVDNANRMLQNRAAQAQGTQPADMNSNESRSQVDDANRQAAISRNNAWMAVQETNSTTQLTNCTTQKSDANIEQEGRWLLQQAQQPLKFKTDRKVTIG